MSYKGNNTTTAWSTLFVTVLCLSLSVNSVDARRFSFRSLFGCPQVPEGTWLGTAFIETSPDNSTLVPQFSGFLNITREIPNVYKGKARLEPTEFNPNAETLPEIPVVDFLMVMNPDTCALASSLYSSAIPFNDVMILSYDEFKLCGPYIGSLDTNILTTTLSRFEAKFLFTV